MLYFQVMNPQMSYINILEATRSQGGKDWSVAEVGYQ